MVVHDVCVWLNHQTLVSVSTRILNGAEASARSKADCRRLEQHAVLEHVHVAHVWRKAVSSWLSADSDVAVSAGPLSILGRHVCGFGDDNAHGGCGGDDTS
ncbi:hypothetical protein PR003_g12627 [Phytophthora rubi]|uniref:Uncharacterized protein n=1 Tax=Phytophthora rubi TaxID=129364 RepID=A0A6A3M522_9STRA|nr:hypothetical protein PR002_g11173 [Phytophthora rubi]KAE9034878.1 hypothetical protein PR001_g9552 [Phytophthora rubi]KAE9336205.1 hypothetical protein PR003_g12627 [Phytophthora rubi]